MGCVYSMGFRLADEELAAAGLEEETGEFMLLSPLIEISTFLSVGPSVF